MLTTQLKSCGNANLDSRCAASPSTCEIEDDSESKNKKKTGHEKVGMKNNNQAFAKLSGLWFDFCCSFGSFNKIQVTMEDWAIFWEGDNSTADKEPTSFGDGENKCSGTGCDRVIDGQSDENEETA